GPAGDAVRSSSSKSDRWATPIIFGPHTLGRMWGTLREFQSVFEPRLGEFRLIFKFQGFLLGQLD
ncbi:MAG: hypothetical protein QOI94_1602, partial [Acidobacteriaceae bacterium]|nr:hypothetical protein [Acidobacteriaceae bacterium]